MVKDFKLNPLNDPKFIKTYFVTYTQDGIEKNWEVLEANDSVSILIYHKEHDSFVLVEQFRPAVYLNNSDGMTVELCAGLVDKEMSLEQIAKEEILEECGFDVPLEKIERVMSFHSAVGFAGSMQTLFYAEVEERMRVNEGGGIDNEQIEVIELPVSKIKEFIFDETIAKTPGLMFSFYWWENKKSLAFEDEK